MRNQARAAASGNSLAGADQHGRIPAGRPEPGQDARLELTRHWAACDQDTIDEPAGTSWLAPG